MSSSLRTSGLSPLVDLVTRKAKSFVLQLRYLLGDDSPADAYLQQFRRTSTLQAVPGEVGQLIGHGSQTVVVGLRATHRSPSWETDELVLKFEIIPGIIPESRLAAERRNELRAREYLDHFLPATLRIVGHGMDNAPSAMTYQPRVGGKRLRHVSWGELVAHPSVAHQLIRFCDAVDDMAQETGQTPDLCGTFAHFDQLSHRFWRSRNVMVDLGDSRVWLVDTGWKDGEESVRQGPLFSRVRTWFRLQTMRFFRWRLARKLRTPGRT